MSPTSADVNQNGGEPLPYWRLSGFYFFYFALLGAWLPYWSLYLKDLGYNAQVIGLLASIVAGTKIIAPNLWGWMADRTKQRLRIIRWGSFLAFMGFSGIFISHEFWPLVIIVSVFSFFWNAVLAQFEVVTLHHLGKQFRNYTRIRLWGSIGFILAVDVLGMVFDWWSLRLLPFVLGMLLLGIWSSSLIVSERPRSQAHEEVKGLASIIKQPPVLVFFMACFLMQVSHGPYYTFYSVYLDSYGYSNRMIGLLWSLGVISEVVLFLFMPRLLARFTLRQILLATLALTVARWLMIGYFPDRLLVLIPAQCLHAATFGSFHAVSIEIVRRYFQHGHQGQGQALYSALSFGAGGALGAYGSGLLWETNPLIPFVLASGASLLAFAIVYLFLKGALVEQPGTA